jgi:hypothetical protein
VRSVLHSNRKSHLNLPDPEGDRDLHHYPDWGCQTFENSLKRNFFRQHQPTTFFQDLVCHWVNLLEVPRVDTSAAPETDMVDFVSGCNRADEGRVGNSDGSVFLASVFDFSIAFFIGVTAPDPTRGAIGEDEEAL